MAYAQIVTAAAVCHWYTRVFREVFNAVMLLVVSGDSDKQVYYRACAHPTKVTSHPDDAPEFIFAKQGCERACG